MGKEFFIGRSILKRLFKDFFVKISDDGKDTRSFMPFRKQRDQVEVVSPRIMLFYGISGSGKSAMIQQCASVADEAAGEIKKNFKTIHLDLEELFFQKGVIPVNEEEMMNVLYDSICEIDSGLKGYFSLFKEMSNKHKETLEAVEERIKEQWPQDSAHMPLSQEETSEERMHRWLEEKISRRDLDMIENSTAELTDTMLKGLSEASSENLILFIIDGYEYLSQQIESWFRQEFLAKIIQRKNRVFTIISGNSAFVRNYRNYFPEETIFPVCFNEHPLSKSEIAQLASKLHVTLPDSDIELIEEQSGGLPLAVTDLLGYAFQGNQIGDLVSPKSDLPSDPASDILKRFLNNCHDWTIKSRIFHLAMFHQFNPKVLAQLWNISFSDISTALNELSEEFAFVKNKQIHGYIRSLLRNYLMQEAAKGSESVLAEFFSEFSKVSSQHLKEMLDQLETAVTSPEKRVKDERYRVAVTDYTASRLWSNPQEAFNVLPSIYLELIHYNPELASHLLWMMNEFREILQPEQNSALDVLTGGIILSDVNLMRNMTAVSEQEEAAVGYLQENSSLNTPIQNALLEHLAGVIEYRKGNFDAAMEHFDKSYSLFGDCPERSILYEGYISIGYAFEETDKQRLISAFTKATSIRKNSFRPIYDLGMAQISSGDYQSAAQSLNEAVNIDPDHDEAWFNLGNAYAVLEQHEEAVKTLAMAVERGAQKPEVYFTMGVSLFKIQKYEDAVSAFKKVVEQVGDNYEAFFLMGKASSLLGLSDDAIESFRNAVEIKPEYLEALKEMGLELYKRGFFDEAADSFEKAAAINSTDAGLWNNIALSQYGGQHYEKTVEAAAKAVELQSDLSEALVTMGNAYTALSNFSAARDAFTKASEYDPKNVEIWNQIGNSYYSQGMYNDAIGAYTKAVDIDETIMGTWFNIGLSYQMQEKYQEAAKVYEHALKNEPDHSDCWLQKGNVHMALNEFEEAAHCFTKTTELTPDSHDAWYKQGLALAKSGKHENAIVAFTKATDLWNSDPDIWFNMGLSYTAANHGREAVNAFTEAATLAETRPDIQFNLGLAKQNVGLYEEGIEAFKKAIELSFEKQEVYFNLGLCHYYLGRYQEAAVSFTKASELYPEGTDALFHLALTDQALGKYGDAIENYEKVIAKNNDMADAWFNLAMAWHAQNNFDKAIELYGTVVSRWPENGYAWFNMGLCYHARNNISEAISAYREASKINPDQADIWYNLAIAFHSQEHYGEAIQAYRKVVQLTPDNSDALNNLGLAYQIWGHYQDAIDSYTKAVELKPDYLTAWGNLGISYFSTGKYDKAVESCERALAIKSDEPWILSHYVVALLLTGNRESAEQNAEKLLSMDTTGEEIKRATYNIRKAMSKDPALQGAQELLQKLEQTDTVPQA